MILKSVFKCVCVRARACTYANKSTLYAQNVCHLRISKSSQPFLKLEVLSKSEVPKFNSVS